MRTLYRLLGGLILEFRKVSDSAFGITNSTTTEYPTTFSHTSKPPIGAIVGGVITGVTVIAIAILVTLWFRRRSFKKTWPPGASVDSPALDPYAYTPSPTLPQPQVTVLGKQIRSKISAARGESSSSAAASGPQMSQTELSTTSQGRSDGPSLILATNIEEIAQALHQRMQAQQNRGDNMAAPPAYEN